MYVLKYIIIFICFSSLIQVSCGVKKIPDGCNGVMCTQIFAMITVQLKDSMGDPFIPDKVETVTSAGKIIHVDATTAIPFENSYTIVDDNNLKDLGVNITNDLIFKVYKNNVVVAVQNYKVKADCCHVMKINGTDSIIVE